MAVDRAESSPLMSPKQQVSSETAVRDNDREIYLTDDRDCAGAQHEPCSRRTSTASLVAEEIIDRSHTSTGHDSNLPHSLLSDENLYNSHLADITYASVELLSPWLPMTDPDHPRAKTWRTWKSRREVVLWTCFSAVAAVLIVNITLLLVLWFLPGTITPDNYIRSLYTGDCNTVKRAGTIAHLFINILSTLMLGASNLCMQLVASPSRKEIDRAHNKSVWVDIGVPSVRNLRHISTWKLATWCALAISSLPIHFLYNSVVFSSIVTNNNAWIVITEDFLLQPFSNTSITDSGPVLYNSPGYGRTYGLDQLYGREGFFLDVARNMSQDYFKYKTEFQNLTTRECLMSQNSQFGWRANLYMVTSRSPENVLLVGDPSPSNASLLKWGYTNRFSSSVLSTLCEWTSRFNRPCSQLGQWSDADVQSWMFWPGFSIDYCLQRPGNSDAEQQAQQCHLQCSPLLLLLVAIFNACKLICIIWVIFKHKEQSICTLGDAIASFLEHPDLTTKDVGVTDKFAITHCKAKLSLHMRNTTRWTSEKLRWWKASTLKQWIFVIGLGVGVLILGGSEFSMGLNVLRDKSLPGLWALGFGKANLHELISWNQPNRGQLGFFVNTLIANSWQVILSLNYVVANAMLTCLLIADEWAGFASERKTLRVSSPRGIQRSSYFISMPLRYSGPLMVMFSVLHWLLSQSIFIIRVIVYDWDGSLLPGWTTSGFSVIPSMFSIILASIVLIAIVMNGLLRRYPNNPGMPLVSTCSLAISSNCHRPIDDTDAHLLPVQWGICARDNQSVASCAFTTSRYVEPPEIGQEIFGLLGTEDSEKAKNRSWWHFTSVKIWLVPILATMKRSHKD